MKPELEKLAQHRLGRAKEAFVEGEHLLTKSAFMELKVGIFNSSSRAPVSRKTFPYEEGTERSRTGPQYCLLTC